jgi:hypothetical protein
LTVNAGDGEDLQQVKRVLVELTDNIDGIKTEFKNIIDYASSSDTLPNVIFRPQK